MQWKITVSFLPGVLDSEGQTTLKTLKKLKYSNITSVKTAYQYLIETPYSDKNKIEEMCKRVLMNPVVHEYSIQLANEAGKNNGNSRRIIIKSKDNDSLGDSRLNSFKNLGYDVKEVKSFKIFVISSKEDLNDEKLNKISRQLLINPIIQEYEVE